MDSSQNMPTSYATSTTTTTKVIITPHYDPQYIRTIPGILKVTRMILDIIGFICIMVSHDYFPSRSNWFSFVAMTGFWVTGILLIFYLFHVIERTYFLPWNLMEFIFCAVWAFFYLIAAGLAASVGSYGAYGVAAFFGFTSMVLYGYDAFLKFKGWRNGELAQGERTVTSTSPTGTTAYY